MLESHSKIAPALKAKRILLALQDHRSQAVADLLELIFETRLPCETYQSITDTGESSYPSPLAVLPSRAAGFLCLEPGDVILLRDAYGSLDEKDDVLELWIPSE